MEVVESVDPQGFDVEYYFEEVGDPSNNSGWISDPFWTSDAEGPFIFKGYRVKARDTSQRKNESGWSTTLTKS